MKTELKINRRRFPVMLQDNRTGEKRADTVTLEKSQLQAAQLVGQSSNELIARLCGKQGFTVLEVGTPERFTVGLDLGGIFELHKDQDKWEAQTDGE